MKYKIEELEKMSEENLVKVYRDAKTVLKKDILISLANNRKFAVLMSKLSLVELVDMAKLHPYKDVVVDTIIEKMESHGIQPRAGYYYVKTFPKEDFEMFLDTLKYKSFFIKIRETLVGKRVLSETLPKKIEGAKKLYEIEIRKINATGKKIEESETKELDKTIDESRVEVNNGLMARVFDKYAKEARKEGRFFGKYGVKTEVAQKLEKKLLEEYISILGVEKEDVARLVAMKEFESYSGELFFIPYSRSI